MTVISFPPRRHALGAHGMPLRLVFGHARRVALLAFELAATCLIFGGGLYVALCFAAAMEVR